MLLFTTSTLDHFHHHYVQLNLDKFGAFTNFLTIVSYITCLSHWPEFWVINPLNSLHELKDPPRAPPVHRKSFSWYSPSWQIWGLAQSLAAPPVEGGRGCRMVGSSFAILVVLLVFFLSPLSAKPGAKPLAKSDPGMCILYLYFYLYSYLYLYLILRPPGARLLQMQQPGLQIEPGVSAACTTVCKWKVCHALFLFGWSIYSATI